MNIIEVSGICKAYGHKSILSDISFTAVSGECIGIVGGNGCGKTTLLSILSGVLQPDSGSIKYSGEEAIGKRKVFQKSSAYVPQENPLIEELSVYDNLSLWYNGLKRTENSCTKFPEPVTMLGLSNIMKMPVCKLSGGTKKRLSIACSLSNNAPVLILDEPGAALDLICKEDIRNYIEEYKAAGNIVIMTSHDLLELSVCTRFYMIKNGKFIEIPTGLTTQELIEKIS